MPTAELSYRLEHPARLLWDAWFFDKEFQTALNRVFRITTSGEKIEKVGDWPSMKIARQLTFDTDRNIPKPIMALVRGVTQVRETAALDGDACTLDVALQVPVIGSRVDYGYQYSWTERDGGSDIVWRGFCDVRIPVVRKLAEGYLLKELTDATRDGAEFVRSWFG